MAPAHRKLPGRPQGRLYVFSITVDWQVLREDMARAEAERIWVLTPHQLFSGERERLAGLSAAAAEFLSFHDLLEMEDMEFCDEEADRLVMAAHGGRGGRDDLVTEYYAALTRLKNERTLEKLRSVFEVEGGAVLSCDLGIVPEVWMAAGLVNRSVPVRPQRTGLGMKLVRMFTNPLPFHFLDWKGERWLLAGRPSRVGQYLDHGAVVLRPLGVVTVGWLNIVMFVARRLGAASRGGAWFWRMMTWAWCWRYPRVAQLACAVHEHNVALAGLAAVLRMDYVNMQDSFLPSYYPSRYLLYRPQVRRFYVWDQFSRGIFDRHGLACVRWPGFGSWILPSIPRDACKPVERILYLASGAGDWTALKNRSDEDLTLALFIEVAKLRPEITIFYRPHPLWLHAEHQGLNSIQRVITGIAETGLPNLMVSQGARADGRQFSLTGNLSAVSSSVDEDIDWADLVMGEHSQTMLVAARRGKVIAGVNVARHTPYFEDYARIGFPLVTSTAELITLLDRLRAPASGGAFLDEYNAVIARHNRENCAEPLDPDDGK